MLYIPFTAISSRTPSEEINMYFHSVDWNLLTYERWELRMQFEEFYIKGTKRIKNEFQKQQLRGVLKDIFLYKNGLSQRLE